nr:hypothetical protein [Tanacetum cinerariifolium]
KAIEKGAGPNWLFDIDSLTKSMNYVPVDAGTNSTNFSGTKGEANQEVKKDVSSLRYIALPNWVHDALLESSSSKPQDESSTKVSKGSGNPNPTSSTSNPLADQMETLTVESPIPTVKTPSLDNILSLTNRFEDILRAESSSDEAIGVEADVSNMETSITASPTPTLRIHKDHPKTQIIGPVDTPIQTKDKSKVVEEQSFITSIHQKTNLTLLHFCLFSCFLSQVEPKNVSDALQDPSWVLKNKKDERGIVIRNKARLVAQGHTQEEGIDYNEVFAHVARKEAIRLFLAYASFIGFTVYQMDPPGFQDPEFPVKVYKVEKAMYGLHQALRAWYGTLSKYLLMNGFQRGTIDQTLFIRRQREDFILVQVYVDDIIFGSSNLQLCREFKALMHEKFQMSAMGELNFFLGLQVLQKEDGIFLSQDKYVGDILKKFRYSDVRSLNTPMDKVNPWGKEGTGKDTIVATSTTEAKYVVAASCCGQVLWIPNQLLDYGHHFIRDFFEKKLISVDHIHIDENVDDLLTKPFDAGRFQYLIGEYNTDFHPMVDFIAASPLRRARIAQSSALLTVADEHASLMRDVSKGEACSTDSGFIADQDKETIAKSSSLPHDSAPRAQEVEIYKLKDRVTVLEDREGVAATQYGDDAPIKGSIDEGKAATERISDDSEELARVLTSMDAATVLAGGIDDPIGSGFIPTAGPPVGDIPTSSNDVPTASPVFATATVVTPYLRRKGKEVMVESDTPKKQRDAEVSRIHAEEELQGMIDSLDRTNETIAKYIQEYQEFASELPLERRIEWISDLVKYQDNYAKTYDFRVNKESHGLRSKKRICIWLRSEVEDFIPMGSKEEAKRYKRKGIRFDRESSKKLKSSEEVIKDVKPTKEIPEEKMKEMIQLVPIKEVYVQPFKSNILSLTGSFTQRDRGATGRSSGWEAAQLVISFS